MTAEYRYMTEVEEHGPFNTILTDKQFCELANEVLCRRCGKHLGHIFDDEPTPTSQLPM